MDPGQVTRGQEDVTNCLCKLPSNASPGSQLLQGYVMPRALHHPVCNACQ